MKFGLIAVGLLVCLVSMSGVAISQQPAIDGIFSEWKATDQVATDPVGDATGAFDISSLSAICSDSVLHLHFDIGKAINLQNGPADEGTLKLILNAKGKTLSVDFRARTVSDGTKKHIGWDKIGFQCLPTFASDKYEMRFDLGLLGVAVGDTVSVQFGGSDQLDQPVQIVMQEAATHTVANADWTKPVGAFRVVNQNTLQNGLADAERGPKFKRLFAAIDADVYCFQEEWKKEDFHNGVTSTLGDVSVHWHSGCAIASHHKLIALPMVLDRAAAGLIKTSDGDSVVVISVHAKCCGYAGSKEDDLRIQQAEQLVGEIKRMRNGEFGDEAKNAPVVLIGDYNLVGTRKPLDVVNAAGLKDVVCTAMDGSAHTWRGLKPDESFWPGRLDLVSTNGFKSVNGRVFDTGRTSESVLKQLELAEDDSTASDHLMVVVDCHIAE